MRNSGTLEVTCHESRYNHYFVDIDYIFKRYAVFVEQNSIKMKCK